MGPAQFWLLAEYHQPINMIGSMTEQDVERVYDETYDEQGNLRPFHVRFPKLKRHPKWQHK